MEVPGEQWQFASANTFALLHEQNLHLHSTHALLISTANTVDAIQRNANDNSITYTEQNLHRAIVYSKSSENTNLHVACCMKHNHASVILAAACSGTAYMAQYTY